MIVCELVQGAALLVIALTLPPLPVLLLLVAVRAVAGQVFQPAARAGIPALVAEKDLATANSTLGFGTNGAEALGPLLAAALLPLIGVPGVLLVDAASFAVAAILISRLPALPPAVEETADGPSTLLGQARAGLGYLWSQRPLRIILLGFCAVVAANGIDDVALLVLGTENLHTDESGVALLLGGAGIGLLAGYALLARGAKRASMVTLLITEFAVSSVGNLLTGLAWAVAVAFVLQTVRGLGIAAMDIASNTLLQRLVPDHMLGRMYGQPLRRDRGGRGDLLRRRRAAPRRDQRPTDLPRRGSGGHGGDDRRHADPPPRAEPLDVLTRDVVDGHAASRVTGGQPPRAE